MSNRPGQLPTILNLLGSLDSPVGTSYRDQWRARQEELAAEQERLAAAPVVTDDDGWYVANQLKGAGAAITDFAGNVVEGLGALEAVRPAGASPAGVPSYAQNYVAAQLSEEQKLSPEELQARRQSSYDIASKTSDSVKAKDFGYDKERNSVEKTKELALSGNWLGAALSVPALLGDQLVQSVPYMLNAPLTAVAVGGETVRERVNNTDGKTLPDKTDVGIGGTVGAISGVLERILPKALFAEGQPLSDEAAKEISESATKYAVEKIGSESLKNASIEGVTEAIQTGVLEYVGQRFGTDKAMSLQEAGLQALEGGLIGGGIGGSLGAVKGAVDSRRDFRQVSSEAARDDGVDAPINGEGFAAPEVSKPVEPIISTGDDSNPDDRFKFELNTDSFVANIRRNLDARRAAAEKTQFVNPEIRAMLDEPDTDLASAARAFGEANGLIPPPKNPNVIDYVAPIVEAAPRFSLAPLDAPFYENAIEFEKSARTEPLASGVEKAISKNIDSIRSARMPENLKDTRLLRNRYRTHLNDVSAALDSHADAFKDPDSLLSLAAKRGGLNTSSWSQEGIDPDDGTAVNQTEFNKAFRQDGGMSPDDLAELASQSGFNGFTNAQGAPDANAALDAVNNELRGTKQYFSTEDETALQSAQSAPAFIRELKEFGSPGTIKRAITLALDGKKLGDNQLRIVQEILDNTNKHSRDDKAIREKWSVRSKAMLANRANKHLDEWRNRDEHLPEATTHEAALNELMSDAVQHFGIDPDKVKAAYTKYHAQYPNMNQFVAAMNSWVTANKSDSSEHLTHEQQNKSSRGSSGKPGAVDTGARIPSESQIREAATTPERIEVAAPSEPANDSEGRNPGLRQSVKPIEGKDIDGDWTEFSEDSGSLKIPRAEMPQIKAEHRGAMVNFLNARDIAHKEETVRADSLKPTQQEFSREKVAKAKRFEGGNRSILISEDNHVLDGHHQWMAAREKGEDVKVIRLKAPIKKLLDAAHEFPSSTTDNTSEGSAELLYKLDTLYIEDDSQATSLKTGVPVRFNFIHNTQSATDLFGIPKKDAPYGRGFEPSARYVSIVSKKRAKEVAEQDNGYISGELTFTNPLVIPADGVAWKKHLSEEYGQKTGKALSKALIESGYDGVITTDGKYTSEVVDLTTFDERKAKYKLDSKNTKTVSRDTAQAVVDRISKNWKVKVKINLIGSIAELPESVKSRLHKSDDEKAEPAALIDESTGNVYINLSRAESEKTIEELIFHEVYTHFGLRQLMGPKVSGLMTRMYLNLGKAEFDRLAKKYGVNVAAYEQAYAGRPDEYRQAILAEELLAHMAEHHKPAVVRLAQEFMGAMRAWLRENGFAILSKISESDMRYLLKQSRETVTQGKQGNVTGLIYSMAGLTKAERKKLNAESKAADAGEDSNSDNDLIDLWAAISRNEDSFQLPFSRKKDFVEIAQELEGFNGFQTKEADELALMNKHGAERSWRVVSPGGDKAAVFQKGDRVWIDVSDLESGDDGKRVYNMVANYAYNNKLVFMGDPAGLSITAKSRRLENMISSALKFGTTDHLQPHKLQLISSHGVPGLKWKKGDTENNILEMIRVSHESVKNQFPEIDDLVYNPDKDIFQDVKNGNEFTRQDFRELAREARGLHKSGGSGPTPTAGSTTLERAVLTGTILRGTRSQKSKLLEQLSGQRSERLNEILYSFGNTQETRSQGGFSVSGLSKYLPGAQREAEAKTLPPSLQDSFKRLGQNKSFVDSIKTEVKRQLTPAGLLPPEVFELKVARDGEINADELHTRHALRGFYDAVATAYGRPYANLKAGTKREINAVMRGEKSAQLAPSVIQALEKMRDDVKRLSVIHVRQLVADAAELQGQGKELEAQSKLAMVETISQNFDTYLHRSYRAFDDKDWPNKVPAKVYQDAVDFLANEYADGGNVTKDDIQLAEKRAHLILHEGTAFDSMGAFISESKLGSKDLSIMKKRKDVPAPIRALLGEYEDAAMNYTKSVTKMSRLVHNHAFLIGMKQTAFDLGLLHEKQSPELGATKKIAAEGSEAYAPLNGLYTTREFEQALKDALGKSNPNAIYDAIVAANGMVKFGKTVLSPTTAFRNFWSSMFFTLSNGHFDWSQMAKSYAALKPGGVYFTERGDAGIKQYLEKLRRLGVVYDSPHAGELMDLLKDSRLEGTLLSSGNPLKDGSRKTLEFCQKFYSAGDDFYKIVGFENEKALLMKHRKMSESEAEKEAAERIRNTYPTYSMIGQGVNKLRRFPVVGTFVSFPAEIIRTSYHITKYLRDDIKEYGLKDPLVQRKLAGYAIAAGAISGLSVMSAAIAGVDDDEEEALRKMAPEWTKNSNILWLWKDEKGNRRFVDLSFLDPYGYWKRPINAVLQDQPLDEALVSGARDMLSPFFGLDIAVKAIGEAAFNSKVDGGPIYNEQDSKIGKAGDIADHLRKALQPGIVTNVERFGLALQDAKSKTGKAYDVKEEMVALVGWRAGTFDPRVALYYQAFEYQDNKSAAAKLLSSVATDVNSVDDDELRSAYDQSVAARREAFNGMLKIVSAGRASGLTDDELRTTLRNSGISIRDSRALVSGKEPEFAPSKTVMKGAIKKAAALFDAETQAEFKRRDTYLNDLRRQARADLLEPDQDE